jgi:group I intron endonuclease
MLMESKVIELESGVYQIRNIINNKRYIGSSARGIYNRWKLHKSTLNRKIHHSILLQRAWDKYGKENFIFEILEWAQQRRFTKKNFVLCF